MKPFFLKQLEIKQCCADDFAVAPELVAYFVQFVAAKVAFSEFIRAPGNSETELKSKCAVINQNEELKAAQKLCTTTGLTLNDASPSNTEANAYTGRSEMLAA